MAEVDEVLVGGVRREAADVQVGPDRVSITRMIILMVMMVMIRMMTTLTVSLPDDCQIRAQGSWKVGSRPLAASEMLPLCIIFFDEALVSFSISTENIFLGDNVWNPTSRTGGVSGEIVK